MWLREGVYLCDCVGLCVPAGNSQFWSQHASMEDAGLARSVRQDALLPETQQTIIC